MKAVLYRLGFTLDAVNEHYIVIFPFFCVFSFAAHLLDEIDSVHIWLCSSQDSFAAHLWR
jgi:hypothetical protein